MPVVPQPEQQDMRMMNALAPTTVPMIPALQQPQVLVVPLVPLPVALLVPGDDYLASQRFTHGGSTRLHPTKQSSPFD
jgi:hypothetical protein